MPAVSATAVAIAPQLQAMARASRCYYSTSAAGCYVARDENLRPPALFSKTSAAQNSNTAGAGSEAAVIRRRFTSSSSDVDEVPASTPPSCADVLRQFSERLVDANSHGGKPHPVEEAVAAFAAASKSGGGGAKKMNAKATLRDLASELCRSYPSLPPILQAGGASAAAAADSKRKDGGDGGVGCDRKSVLRFLAVDCSPNDDRVEIAVRNYLKHHETGDPDVNESLATGRLREACTPRYEAVLRALVEQDAALGMRFLLQLRRDVQMWLPLLHLHHHHDNGEDELAACLKQLDRYLREDVFSAWFSPGMLQIRRITYDGTPAACIETIARQEAVHPMRSLDDLRNRLGPSRRVFGLFHPLLPPNQPLVVLHVSLQRDDIPASMEQVHEYSSADDARVAAFYSISNLQSGLSGVGLGEYLIKEAVQLLRREMQTLETFVTLSPLPSFRKWLEDKVFHEQRGKFAVASGDLIDGALLERLSCQLQCKESEALSILVEKLAEQGPGFVEALAPGEAALVRDVVTRLAARYLATEKHRRKPLDGVARFHIANGAELHRVNWMADCSAKGWRNSFGVMVNYRYDLDALHDYQAQYEVNYRIPISERVQALLPYK